MGEARETVMKHSKAVNALDVAAYILGKMGTLPAMKLQKLVYYAQAWSLVWDGKPLFRNKIEAWANGPVVPALYQHHRGCFQVSRIPSGNRSKLDHEQRETVDAVIGFYGDKPPHWLSDLTHMEDPWRNTRNRAGLASGERGNAVIPIGDMYEYYEAL